MEPQPKTPAEARTKPPVPIWSIPLLLAVLGITLLVGNLPFPLAVAVAVETVIVAGYFVRRARTPGAGRRPVSNLIALFPGHLLLLLAIALLPEPDRLAALWTIVPITSLAYDLVSRNAPEGLFRTSTSIGLYAILWAVLFALLERIIAIKRGFGPGGETIAAVAFGVFGILFISLGIYRHCRAGKE